MSRPFLLDVLRDRVLLCDGAVGTRVQGMSLDVDLDFHGREHESRSLRESDPLAIEITVIADDRRIRLKPGTQSPQDLGIGSNVHAPPTGSAVPTI